VEDWRIVAAVTRVGAVAGPLGTVDTEAGRGTGVATDAAVGEAPEEDAGVTAGGANGGTAETDKWGCERMLPPPIDMVGASAGATDGV